VSGPTTFPLEAIPADVRAAGPEACKLYETALGFEQLLVRQLATQLVSSTQDGEGEDGDGGGTSSLYRQMLPDALADGISAGGGTGLARELYRTLSEERR
jgi:Rod binding domain-containing protein